MPLARIITRSAEEAQEVAGQLRARGYTVEIVSPEQILNTTADVELRLEECSVDEALSNAGLFPDKDLPVFVAPGAIAGGRPLVQIPLVRSEQKPELARENIFSIPQIKDGEARTGALGGEMWAQTITGEEGSARTAGEPSAESAPEVYVYEDATLSPLQRLRLPRIRLPRFSWPRLRLPQFSLPRPAFRLPRVRVRVPRFSFRLPKMTLRIPRPHWHLPRFSWPHLSLRSSLRSPRIKVRVPSLHMPRVALRVPRVNWRIPGMTRSTPKKSSPWQNATPLAPAPLSSPESVVRPHAVRQSQRMSRNGVFWDTAMAFGILAVSVLMVGGLLHSKTPLPGSLTQASNNTGQRVPFAAVKAQLPGAPANANAGATSGEKAAAEKITAPRLAAPELAGQTKPSPQVTQHATKLSRRTPSSRKPAAGNVKLAQRSRSTVADGDYVADDVVIHYGKKN